MKRQRWSVPLALVTALALLLAACGSSGDDPAASNADEEGSAAESPVESSSDSADGDGGVAAPDGVVTGGEVVYGIISDGTGFNTTAGIGEGAIRIITSLTDGLVTYDAEGNVVPTILESIEPNDDATVWTLVVREGITFHDGVPVDADAIRTNLAAFQASQSVGFALSRVKTMTAVDERTLEIEMHAPWAAFPNSLVGQPGWIVSPSTIGQSDTFVGTGPFVLESWTPGDTAVVVRNDDYWLADQGYPYLDKITFKVISDQSARRQALEAGDIDAYYAPGDADILDFQANDDIVFHQNAGETNEGLYILNTTAAPTDDLRVRRALAHAIDRDLIIEQFRSGLTTPANSFISPASPYYVETDYPGYDPEAATSLVEEYESENGPIEFVLKVTNTPAGIEVAEVVVSFWADVGIDVEIEAIQPGTSVPPVIADDFSAIAWAQFSSVDPDGEYNFFHSGGGLLNWSNLVDERMDEAFETARVTFDEEERVAAYATVQEVLAEQVPMLWVDHFGPIEGVAASPEMHGILGQTTLDGDPQWGFTGGSYFGWAQVWKG